MNHNIPNETSFDEMIERQDNMARTIAPEDIRRGMYVTVMRVVYERIPFFCDSGEDWKGTEPKRLHLLPFDVRPMKVIDVCVPFVFVKTTKGKYRVIDIRRYRLARVADSYGQKVFKKIRDRKKKRRERKARRRAEKRRRSRRDDDDDD